MTARKKDIRVLVLGASGMLGHKLAQVFPARFDTVLAFRSRPSFIEGRKDFGACRVVDGVRAERIASVRAAINRWRPDAVVNCIGIVKQFTGRHSNADSILVNSLFPHQLADLCAARNARLVHISTDCVFSGRKGMYVESDPADADDLYGRTKFLGEVSGPGCLTIRTSIIGREIGTKHGLVEWFLSNRGGKVQSFTKAVFSGFPTIVLADIIGNIIEKHPAISGLRHVSSEPVAKHDLLRMIKDSMKIDIETEPSADLRIDRSLDSSLFRKEADFKPPAWQAMVDMMAADAMECGLYDEA